VCVSGELRYRQYDRECGRGKETVKMPVGEIQAVEMRRLDPKASVDGKAV
jgi:hypothetical protein